jgi:uncharacterized protein
MSPLEFSAIFSVGLVSGMHCVGMCGPIVLSYSLGMRQGRLAAHAAYNGGRILTYMFLGALAGTAGHGLGLLGRMAGMASGARIAAGAAMIVAGALLVRTSSPLVRIQSGGIGGIGIIGRFSAAMGSLIRGPRASGKFALGLALGFLPCGLIYAALLKAIDSAGAVAGGLTMLAFGLGTAVALGAVGAASSFAGLRLGRWSNRLAAASVMAFGAILLWRGLAAGPVCHG